MTGDEPWIYPYESGTKNRRFRTVKTCVISIRCEANEGLLLNKGKSCGNCAPEKPINHFIFLISGNFLRFKQRKYMLSMQNTYMFLLYTKDKVFSKGDSTVNDECFEKQ